MDEVIITRSCSEAAFDGLARWVPGGLRKCLQTDPWGMREPPRGVNGIPIAVRERCGASPAIPPARWCVPGERSSPLCGVRLGEIGPLGRPVAHRLEYPSEEQRPRPGQAMGGAVIRRHVALFLGAAVLVLVPLLCILGTTAGASTTGDPDPIALPPEAQPVMTGWPDADPREILLSEGGLLLLVILECGMLMAELEAFEAWHDRRADEVAGVRGQIASALQRNRLLRPLSVTPVVRLPLWRPTRATVELRGRVPTPRLRAAVRRTVERVTAQTLAGCRIDDRHVIAQAGEVEAT
jgi:hypothetical protein